MKKSFIIATFCTICINVTAQTTDSTEQEIVANENSDSLSLIQSALDACLSFSDALASGDINSIRQAGEAMGACDLKDFGTLRCKDDSVMTELTGHAVFNQAFADSLVAGRDAYQMADNINRSGIHRGQMKPGQILTKTCGVKARGITTYSFPSTGRQELAVVAEHGGRITTRIHVVNKATALNRWYNDTTDVVKGRNSRKAAFELPANPTTTVTLEIKNCTNKNISFVIISN